MKKLLSFLTLSLSVLLFLIFYLKNYSNSELRLALDNTVETLDHAKAYSDDSLLISSQVLEPLYQYHYLKRPYTIQPLTAEGPPVYENDDRTLRIKIKKNIFYHSHPAFQERRELKAEDFVVQFKRIALESLNSPGKSLFRDLVVGFDEYSDRVQNDWRKLQEVDLEGVRAEDNTTLIIKLKRPEPNMLYYLALNFFAPTPWEIVEYFKNNLDKVLVGTGPYFYAGSEEDHFLIKKNEDYRPSFYPSVGDRYANVENLLVHSKEKIPFINEVRFFVTESEEQRWEMFLNKDIDLLSVPKSFLPELYSDSGELNSIFKKKDVQLTHFPILANRWLGFNMKDPLVGRNKNLRKAISYAINYEEYLKVISQNTNLRANSILVPGISGYLPTKDVQFNYDPIKARKYMRLAGFTSDKKMPVIKYSTRGKQSINMMEAQLIKKYLEEIGIKVEIETLDFPEFLRKGRAGELMFFTDNWLFDYPDGENIVQLLVSKNFPGINKSAYSNPRVDELYQQLKLTTNSDFKDKILQEIEEMVFKDLPWIPMMYESSFVLQHQGIKNFRKSSIIRNYIKYLKVER